MSSKRIGLCRPCRAGETFGQMRLNIISSEKDFATACLAPPRRCRRVRQGHSSDLGTAASSRTACFWAAFMHALRKLYDGSFRANVPSKGLQVEDLHLAH